MRTPGSVPLCQLSPDEEGDDHGEEVSTRVVVDAGGGSVPRSRISPPP